MWMAHSNSEILVIFDEDWRSDWRSVAELVFYLRTSPSEVAFVQGRWEFLNEKETWITRGDSESLRVHHHFEMYLRSLQAVPFHMNGSFMAFKRDIVKSVGGFNGNYLSEDIDIAMRLYQQGFKGWYIDTISAQGSVAQSLMEYRMQKSRWISGRFEILISYWRFVLSCGPFHGRIVNLQYLFEYITPVTGAILASVIVVAPLSDRHETVIIGLILAPSASRFLITLYTSFRCRSDSILSGAYYDLILRYMLAVTCAVLFVSVMVRAKIGWRWLNGAPIVISVSALSLLLLGISFQLVNNSSSAFAWMALVITCILSIILWVIPDKPILTRERGKNNTL